jgi:hypothetical protein
MMVRAYEGLGSSLQMCYLLHNCPKCTSLKLDRVAIIVLIQKQHDSCRQRIKVYTLSHKFMSASAIIRTLATFVSQP